MHKYKFVFRTKSVLKIKKGIEINLARCILKFKNVYMYLTTNLGENSNTIIKLDSECLIIKEITIWDLAGNLIAQKDVLVFNDKNVFQLQLPRIRNKSSLLLLVSTSCGNYSHLIT